MVRPRTARDIERNGGSFEGWKGKLGVLLLTLLIGWPVLSLALRNIEEKELRDALHERFDTRCVAQTGQQERCQALVSQHDYTCANKAYAELPVPRWRRLRGDHRDAPKRDPHEVYWHCMMRQHDPSWQTPATML